MKLLLILLFVAVAKTDIANVNLQQYENKAIPDLKTMCSFFTNVTLRPTCRDQLDVICENQILLWTIFDASAKFPYAGLSYSSPLDYGNFDQCMSVSQNYGGGRILGEYCTSGLVIPYSSGLEIANDNYTLAVCRPNGCKASDYNILLNYFLFQTESPDGLFLDESCQTVEYASVYSTGDIIVLTIFGIFVLLMIVSSLYEFYLKKRELQAVHPLCISFSIVSNGKKLMDISRHNYSKETIHVFHGLRVISMLWIVAGHTYTIFLFPSINIIEVNDWLSRLSSFYIIAADLSVDTFFYMSGFLLSFRYFKDKQRTIKEQLISVPYMIAHRYLRLTPAVFMVFLMVITIFVHLGSGPGWISFTEMLRAPCESYWWRLLLYVQNYFDECEICMMPTWYLSADMQMFIISPLVLIPLSLLLTNFGFKFSLIALLILNIVLTVLPIIINLCIDYQNAYDTHSRLIDYFIGVMAALFMREKIDEPFLYMTKEGRRFVINFAIWVTGILGMLSILVYYQINLVKDEFKSLQVFPALMRPAWCITLSWITYSCYHAQGGFVNWILCRPIFQVLGRLTYCIYLLHGVVVYYNIGIVRTKLHSTNYNVFYQVIGTYAVSVIGAIFWTLAFESPLIVIAKYLLGGGRTTRKCHFAKAEEEES